MKDFYGKDADELKKKKLWLLDMDGTIYMGEQIFPGTLSFLQTIRDSGGEYMFLTNNSSKGVSDYVKKVNRMEIPAGPEQFFTSVDATILYLKKQHPGARVYCQGTRSFIENLRTAGISVTEEKDESAEVVLVGFDTELTFEKLTRTCEMLRKDRVYIAANPDYVCPVEGGYVPDCGSMCIGISYATGKTPLFIGKPEPTMINIVREKKGYTKEETVIVGDRLYTDIASGLNAGVTAICVLSGEATEADIATGEFHPDYVFRSVTELQEGLSEK